MMKVEAYCDSRQGADHFENEDAILFNKKKNLFAIADGVTLPFGGKEASTRSVKYLNKFFAGDLEEAFEKVNAKILEDKEKNPAIGYTTLVAAHIKNDKTVEIASVGDSRAYLINHGIELLLAPSLNSVIGQQKILIDVWKHKLDPTEIIMLCTDGVINVVKEDEIEKIVKSNSMRDAIVKILDVAENRPTSYNDDKTIILLKLKDI